MPTFSNDCVVGLGSNLGDRRQILCTALQLVAARAKVTAISALYGSPAIGPRQPDYLNAAVRLVTPLSALNLLDELLAVERVFGRQRRERWGPRTLDLDILWIAGEAITSPRLTVPHPHLTERAFALRPLVDVAPEARDPATGRAYQELIGVAGGQAAKVAGPRWCERSFGCRGPGPSIH